MLATLATAVLLTACTRSDGDAANGTISAADIDAALSAAEEYLAAREYASAEVILEKLLEKRSDIVEAWEALGQVRFSQAMEAQAKGSDAAPLRNSAYDCYARAVVLQPTSAGLQHSAGIMALSAGNDEAALRHFAEAGKLDPRNVQHPLYEAQVLLKQHKLDEAEAALQRSHAIDAAEPFTISSLAVIAMEREEYERAIELITQARAIDPRSLAFRVQEARIRRRAGEVRSAIELLQALSPADRADPGVTVELAACHDAVGDFTRSAAVWTHRLESSPTDWQAALNAAEAHARAGQRREATTLYDIARRIAPNEPAVQTFGERLAAMQENPAP